MRFVHISDLHLGKRVNEFSMIEDQRYVLEQVIDIIIKEHADAVLIAGDVYDKAVAPAEAVVLFDTFLTRLSQLKFPVCIISGNHDSAERIAFGASVFQKENIYIAPVFDGTLKKASFTDEYGEADVYMLPFIKPSTVKRFYDEEVGSYTEAVSQVLKNTPIDKRKRNVLLAHQFVTGAVRCDSEEIVVGGLDNVDSSVFADFDYVALGHIHNAQRAGADTIRYCGTLLKYSFSEAKHEKSVTVVDLKEKKSPPVIRTVPVKPLHDLREIKGMYSELTLRENYIHTAVNDYMHITLTDEEDIPDAVGKMRSIYPNIMKLDYDNARTRSSRMITEPEEVKQRTPMELFEEFYELQNNQEISDCQKEYLQTLIQKVWRNERDI